MHILVFGNGSLSVAQQERKLCVEFAKKGHSVTLICSEKARLFDVGEVPSHPNLRILDIPFSEYRHEVFLDMCGWPPEHKLDVVLGMDQSVSPFVADFKAKHPTIRSYIMFLDLPMHVIGGQDTLNYDVGYSQRFYYWLQCSLELDGTIFNNGVAIEQYKKMYNRDAHLVFYAISNDDYLDKPIVPPTKDYVFGCNRLIKYKGTEYTFFALRRTKYKYKHVFVSGEEREIENIKALSRELSQKITLYERISEDVKMDLTYHAKVVVYPQITEWIGGLSIIEGWSVKTPGICFDYPVLRELYGDCVLYAKPRSAVDLREKIKTLYEDADLNKEMAENGYKRFKKMFTRERMAEKLLGVLTDG